MASRSEVGSHRGTWEREDQGEGWEILGQVRPFFMDPEVVVGKTINTVLKTTTCF